jgi:hypothetical protein
MATGCEHRDRDEASGQVAADEQIAEAVAAGHESLSLECQADAARLERLLSRCIAPGQWQVFHHQGTITTR